MKKTLTVIVAVLLVVTLALSLTACDKCKDGHAWNEGEITTPATCTSNGTKTYTCAVCGATRDELIPASHQLGDWIAATDEAIGHYTCSVCGKYFDASGREISDLTPVDVPTEEGKVTLYWEVVDNIEGGMPSYVSIWFTGTLTGWATEPGAALEAQRLDDSNIYYVMLAVDKLTAAWDEYCLALGYNATAVNETVGLDWNYKSAECAVYAYGTNATFAVADGDTSASLGTHTFNSAPAEPEGGEPEIPTEVEVTFTVSFNAALPEGYNVYVIGEMTNNWDTSSALLMTTTNGIDYSVSTVLMSGKYYFKVVACKGVFSWEDTERVEYGNGTDNAQVKVPTTGGTVALFASVLTAPGSSTVDPDPTPSGPVDATFTVTFDTRLPEGYNVYLVGEMTDWETNAQKMVASADGLTYSVTLKLESRTYEFKVVACKGAFAWMTEDGKEYGNGTANAKITVPATGGTVELFGSVLAAPGSSVDTPDPTPAGAVDVTFTMTFDAAVPDGYTIYLVGEMTNWGPENGGTPVAMTASSSRQTFSASLKLASGDYRFKVLACQGSFTWDGTQYGGSADGDGNASVTVPAAGGTIALFATAQKAPSSSGPVDGSQYIIVGGSFSWDETTSDSNQYLTHVSGSIYTIDVTFARNDTFKIKPNVSGWDGAIDGNATINVSFASGVTQVSGLFSKAPAYENISVKYDCTVTITVDVSAKTLDILVKSVNVIDASSDEYIITGSMTGWVTNTTNSAYIFTHQGGGMYSITLTFSAGDLFKIKLNEGKWGVEYGWHNENCQGGAKSYFTEGPTDGNMQCVTACTVTITLNTNTGAIVFELA